MNEHAATRYQTPRPNLDVHIERARKALAFYTMEPLPAGDAIAGDIAELMSDLLHLAVDAKVCDRDQIGYMQWLALRYFHEDIWGRHPDER